MTPASEIGTVRVNDPGAIQDTIHATIHETGSCPQNRGKGGSRIVREASPEALR